MKRSSRAPYRFASLSTMLGLFSLVGSASVSAQPAPASPPIQNGATGAAAAPAVSPSPSMVPAAPLAAPLESAAPQPAYPPPPPAQPAYPPPPPGQPGYPPPQYAQPGYPPQYAQPGYPPQYGQPAYPPRPYPYPSPPPPPPPWQPASPDAVHHGFLALPYLGVHSYRGSSGKDLGPGVRLGTLLGGRISPMISLNAELSLDVLNPQDVLDGVDETLIDFVLAFSPLLHIPIAPGSPLEIVVGPKLGFRVLASSVKSLGEEDTVTASGGVAGVNAGVFGQVGPAMAVGALLSLDVRSISSVDICTTPAGGSKICTTDDNPSTGDKDKTFAFNAALLF